MTPTFHEFLAKYPGCPRVKVVAFINAPPTVHVIPEELSSWQEGECAEDPSSYEVANAEFLTHKALAAAVAEEERASPLVSLVAMSDQDRPKYERPTLARSNAIAYRKPRVTGFQIRRKPLPATARPAPFAIASSLEKYTAMAEYDLPRPLLRRAVTTFDDILPIHKMDTWQNVDNAEWQRRRQLSIPALAVDSYRKAKYQVKKAVKRVRE